MCAYLHHCSTPSGHTLSLLIRKACVRPHLAQPDKKQVKLGKRFASLLQSRFRLEIFLVRISARPTRPVSCNRRSSFNSKRHHYSFFPSETPTIRFSHSVLGLPLSKATGEKLVTLRPRPGYPSRFPLLTSNRFNQL